MRVLVRVPEAYPLLGPYEATRPGLLVLDADGRRVAALAMGDGPGETRDPSAVAKWLAESAKAPARERFLLHVAAGPGEATVARFLAEASGYPGVLKAEAGKDGALLLAKPGAVSPEALARLATQCGVTIECREPVPVTLTLRGEPDPAAAAKAIGGVAGAWFVLPGKGVLHAWVTRLLLDPAALDRAAPAYAADVETRRYAIPGVSLGPPGMKVAHAVQDLAGVLAVFPALGEETVSVVGRTGGTSWPGVLAALREIGLAAREKP